MFHQSRIAPAAVNEGASLKQYRFHLLGRASQVWPMGAGDYPSPRLRQILFRNICLLTCSSAARLCFHFLTSRRDRLKTTKYRLRGLI